MANEITTEIPSLAAAEPEWHPPKPPTDLIFDDGEPLESNRHRIAMNVLIDSALHALAPRTDFFAGGNMFIYFSNKQVFNRDFRGPDFFAVLEVDGSRERQGWVVWEEDGRYPDVIVELMSPSTTRIDLTTKKDLYEKTFHTLDYFVYDPFDPTSLQGWHLNARRQYEPLTANERGWLWCETLQLWLGLWQGSLRREPPTGGCFWLRFFDREGNLILLQEELAEQERLRADQAQQRAELAQQQAELAQQQAELAQQQAEQERLRANQEQQRAELAQQQAEQERLRAKRLATRLRELGLPEETE